MKYEDKNGENRNGRRILPLAVSWQLTTVLALSLCGAHGLWAADQLTPLVVSPLTAATQPVLGTDGRRHAVYELVLTNASVAPVTLEKVEVLDGNDPAKVLATYADAALLPSLRTTASRPAGSAQIEPGGTRLFLLDVAFDAQAVAPSHLLHRLGLLGVPTPKGDAAPVQLTYTAGEIALRGGVPTIGPPLAGEGWVALNGCCGVDAAHRPTGLPINGKIYFAQRFAIDWMRLDAQGRIMHGNAEDVHSYIDYGAPVLAVADGTVVSALDTLDDQVPGTLPDPKTINLENVDGNHVVLDLGNGVFALYAHLVKHSLTVTPGSRVHRGQVLGKLGNTGNTSGPHLHFQLMDSSSSLGSNGLPYGIDSFALVGQLPAAKFAAATSLEGDWSGEMLKPASQRHGELPMDLMVVNF
jgi:hypothetical protein